MSQRLMDFRRCECVNGEGRRTPCVPPRKGFMCRRQCTVIKSVVVLKTEKQRRLWRAHQKFSIEDAVRRAEHEAIKYLNSPAGSMWLTMGSYAKAEEAMNEKLAVRAVETREVLIEKKKNRIVARYGKQIANVKRERDRKSNVLKDHLRQLEEQLKVARPGYMTRRLQKKMEALVQQMEVLEEHQRLIELTLACEMECEKAEMDLLNDYVDDDDAKDGEEVQSIGNSVGEGAVRRVKEYQAPEAAKSPIKTVMESVRAAMKAAGSIVNNAATVSRQIETSMRVALDIVDLRLHKMLAIGGGDFAEIQREAQHEMYTQYVNHTVATARRTAENSFRNFDSVRQMFQGKDTESAFSSWKSWIKTNKRRKRR